MYYYYIEECIVVKTVPVYSKCMKGWVVLGFQRSQYETEEGFYNSGFTGNTGYNKYDFFLKLNATSTLNLKLD